MIFDDAATVFRTLAVGTVAYAGLVVALRLSGKRTLSKWNAFDLVVTVALGSSLATTLLSAQTTLVQGLTGIALLVLLQFVLTWAAVRWGVVDRSIKARPTLLLYRGALLRPALCAERVTEEEVRAAVWQSGIGALESVDAVVLETDGSVSVIPTLDRASALVDVRGYDTVIAADSSAATALRS